MPPTDATAPGISPEVRRQRVIQLLALGIVRSHRNPPISAPSDAPIGRPSEISQIPAALRLNTAAPACSLSLVNARETKERRGQ